MEADKDHLHHKLMKIGLNQRQTVLIMYFISMLLGLAAIIVSDTDPFVGFAVVVVVVFSIFYLAGKIGLFRGKEER
jgi:UDP-GlcNAc:undecaprenyl-phosphate GlcNAc-1-phosphate transferase